jgi:hypothetical protein
MKCVRLRRGENQNAGDESDDDDRNFLEHECLR